MIRGWRVSALNGVLLAAYFIPNWTLAAFKIAVSPVQGLYDGANVAVAMAASDHLVSTSAQMVRFAWLVALGKVVVAAFFLLFLIRVVRDAITQKGGEDEALGFALGFGIFISMAGLVAASVVHEPAALRLHATESLLLIGGAILLLVENEAAFSLRRPRAGGSSVLFSS